VDRKALLETHSSDRSDKSDLSDSSLESRILTLWSGILGHPVSDPTANFFDLGGNSIHIAVVHVRLQELTGREFPITDLFANPSARAISSHLSPRQGTQGASTIQDRARLAKAGFARFQRPLNR
jgi:acyl carrier protein